MIQLISYKVANHCILHLQNKTVINIDDKGALIICDNDVTNFIYISVVVHSVSEFVQCNMSISPVSCDQTCQD